LSREIRKQELFNLKNTAGKTTLKLNVIYKVQGGSNMTGTDLCVNKPHCAAALRP